MKAHIYPGRLDLPDWNNIECLQKNRMPAHAYSIQFPDLASCMHAAAGNQRYVSPYVFLLNGAWNFAFYPSITRMPENILSLRSGFHPTQVPSCWQTPGPDQHAPAGARFSFPVIPPRVPDEVPVGVYRRHVRLPLLLGGLRKRIVFQGVSGAFHLFINGKAAGYSVGGYLPAEFDITTLMHDGDNEILILVYGHHAAGYLENHEKPRWSGLFRDVYIEAIPAVSVYDSHVRTLRVDEGALWRFDIDLDILSYRISTESPQVKVLLMDQDLVVYESQARVALMSAADQWGSSPVQATAKVHMTAELSGIRPWTAETPELYQLYVCVQDRQGRELSCIHQSIGFCHYSQDQGKLLLNGTTLNLFPVRRQHADPKKGLVLTLEDMISQIRQYKRHNINTILTVHEPVDPIFLELCDIYGIYVIAETDAVLPRDQQGLSLQDDPQFLPSFLDRTQRLVKTAGNHPCIVCWSMAGDRPGGQNHDAMSTLARSMDPDRPVLTGLPENAVILSEPVDRPFSRPFTKCGPLSSLQELAQHHQPIVMEAVDAENGAFILTNRRNFTPTGDLSARFTILRDGLDVLQGVLDNLRMEPGDRKFLEIPYGDLRFEDGSEYFLRVTFEQISDSLFASEGHVVGFHEFLLAAGKSETSMSKGTVISTRLRLERDRHISIISGSRFYLVFNHLTGTFDACRFGDKELYCGLMPTAVAGRPTMVAGPRVHLTAGRSGDRKAEPQVLSGLDESLQPVIESVVTACDGTNAVLETVEVMAASGHRPSFRVINRYDITNTGAVRLFVQIESQGPEIIKPTRVGIRLFLRPEFTQAVYYGKGPHPGDRSCHRSQQMGIHRLSVAPDREPVTGRLENDSRLDARYLKLQEEQGFGVLITGDRPFCFSARAHCEEDRAGASIGTVLPARPYVEVILDEEIGNEVFGENGQSWKMVYTLTPIVS